MRPLLACLLVLHLVAMGKSARADGDFARVERVEVEPTFGKLARVRVWMSLLHIEGSLIDSVKPEELLLEIGGAKRKEVPEVLRFENDGDELDVMLLVETSKPFAPVLESLEEPMTDFLKKLPKGARAAVSTYGNSVHMGSFVDPARAAKDWVKVVPDDDAPAPQLLDGVTHAVHTLSGTHPQKPGTVARKLLLVISDGVNTTDDLPADMQKKFTELSKTASEAGITIDCIAFSGIDNRRPFLNLGQMSKKTNGMFRWAKNVEDLPGNVELVMRELRRQMVLTYLVPTDQISGKSVKIVCKSAACGDSLDSNPVKASPSRCALNACPTTAVCVSDACTELTMVSSEGGIGTYVALGGGVLALGAIGTVVVFKRRGKRKGKADVSSPGTQAGFPPGMAPPGTVPGAVGAMPAAPPAPMPFALPAGYKLPAGMELPAIYQQAMAAQAFAPAAPQVPTIQIMNGPRQGQTLPLRHGFTVGKLANCDLIVDDGFTSGHHAQFLLDAHGVSVVDMGSTNGTYINNMRVQSSRISSGMTVRVGQIELRLL